MLPCALASTTVSKLQVLWWQVLVWVATMQWLGQLAPQLCSRSTSCAPFEGPPLEQHCHSTQLCTLARCTQLSGGAELLQRWAAAQRVHTA